MDTPRPHPDDHGAAIATTEAHPQVKAALRFLATVLADPQGSSVDVDLAADVADVVSDLIDTHPPMPPLDYPDHSTEDGEGNGVGDSVVLLGRAASRLRIAAFSSTDSAERVRAGIAVRRLHALIERWQP